MSDQAAHCGHCGFPISDDPPFDPEGDGWDLRKDDPIYSVFRGPTGRYHGPAGWVFVPVNEVGLSALMNLNRARPFYMGEHPTRSLVAAIIQQNGGGA